MVFTDARVFILQNEPCTVEGTLALVRQHKKRNLKLLLECIQAVQKAKVVFLSHLREECKIQHSLQILFTILRDIFREFSDT